jgi:hypothetical protein
MTTRKIRNRAKCLLCGDIIESKHRHDFVKCSCGEIFVDGGNEYWRAGAMDFKNFERIDNTGKKYVDPLEEKDT